MRRDINKIIMEFKLNDSINKIFDDEKNLGIEIIYDTVKILTVTDEMVDELTKFKLLKRKGSNNYEKKEKN